MELFAYHTQRVADLSEGLVVDWQTDGGGSAGVHHDLRLESRVALVQGGVQ